MKIKRFDKTECGVLERAQTEFGYYDKGVLADRAEIFGKEGLLNPRETWHEKSWMLTEKGKIYYAAFMAKLRKQHGHEWKKDSDGNIDEFAMSYGNHNGPECVKCGYDYCQHCKSEFDVPKCTKQADVEGNKMKRKFYTYIKTQHDNHKKEQLSYATCWKDIIDAGWWFLGVNDDNHVLMMREGYINEFWSENEDLP